jgi:CBS domain containing-hemolysin-like protein
VAQSHAGYAFAPICVFTKIKPKVSQVAAKLEIDLTDPEGNLSQWLEIKLGQPPKAGQTYAEAGLQFTVRRIRRRHVFDVSIKRQELSSAA